MSSSDLFRPLALALAGLLVHCASLDALPAGTCGNGVVDANEDCDTFPASCGAPSSGVTACRLTCAPGGPTCPDGWGCSVDGICRQPTGTFEAPNDPVSAGVETMIAGDFDGDGRADLLGSGPRGAANAAKVRVHFFGDGAALADTVSFSAPFTTPRVRDLDGDGRDDFAFGAAGIGIMLGRADRSFAPVLFPSFRGEQPKLVPIFVRQTKLPPPAGPTSFVALSTLEENGTKLSLLASFGGEEKAYAVAVPAGPEALVGKMAWGPVHDGLALSTCGEVVFALSAPSGSQVVVASPCTVGAGKARWWSERAPIVVPVASRITGGVVLADEDGDGHLDILVATESGVLAIPGTGTDFGAPYQPQYDGQPAFDELPIAAADLNEDGAYDYVMPRGVRLSQRLGDGGVLPPLYEYYPVGRTTRWTEAVIGQLNGDGHPDFVAASDEQPDLDFVAGTGKSEFTSSTVTTTGHVSRLAAGDFDGDGILDLALVQGQASAGEEELAIAYGRLVGPPEAPRSVGTLSGVTLVEATPSEGTAVDNLGIFLERTSAKPGLVDIAFALLLGSGDRQPLAPLLLGGSELPRDTPPNVTRDWVPQAVFAGPIVEPTRVDLVAVAVGYQSRGRRPLPPPHPVGLWAAKGTPGTLDFAGAEEVLDLEQLAGGFDSTESVVVHSAMGDVDFPPDGLLEAVVFVESRNLGPSLQVIRGGQSGLVGIPLPGVVVGPQNQVDLLDVDGDGALDVALLSGPRGQTKLTVYFGDGKGSFAVPGLALDVPPIDGAPDPDTVAIGATQITTGGTAAGGQRLRELALVTRRRVLRVRLRGREIAAVETLLSGLTAGTGITAGDFDGDGVEDLAVADGGSIRVLRQKPRLR
mgnify:CR=1 FL=1